jgi:heat shock protein 5
MSCGIDFGSASSALCIKSAHNDSFTVIANVMGNRMTPSMVSFSANDADILVGDSAVSAQRRNMQGTILDVKEFMGLENIDSTKIATKEYAFTVKEAALDSKDTFSACTFQFTHKGEEKTISPEEVASHLISQLHLEAKEACSDDIEATVVGVPYMASENTLKAITKAGELAGVTISGFCWEPVAAAIAHRLDQEDVNKTVLVYDMGASSVTATVLKIAGGIISVLSSVKHITVGGNSFEEKLSSYVADTFKRKHRSDISGSKKSMFKVKQSVLNAIRILSSSKTARINVDGIYEGIDFNDTINRARFDLMCDDLFEKAMEPIAEALSATNLAVVDIDDIIPVGGSMQMPKLLEVLTATFKGKAPLSGVSTQEAVAIGCAKHAEALKHGASTNMTATEKCLSLSIGVESMSGSVSTLLAKGTPLPATHTFEASTWSDDQSALAFNLYEGEHPTVTGNHKLARVIVSGISSGSRGTKNVAIKLIVEDNGNMIIKASESTTKLTVEVVEATDAKFFSAQITQNEDGFVSAASKNAELKTKSSVGSQLIASLMNVAKTSPEKYPEIAADIEAWYLVNKETATVEEIRDQIVALNKGLFGGDDDDSSDAESSDAESSDAESSDDETNNISVKLNNISLGGMD